MGFFSFFRPEKEQLTTATDEEKRDAMEELINLSTADYGYYLLLILSIIITTAGLLLQSMPVVIGGMIIAPILTPLMALSLSLIMMEFKGLVRAFSITLLSIVVALIVSSLLTYLAPPKAELSFAAYRLTQNSALTLYFIVAFCSGMVGTFAIVKKHLSASISGVAVSASLVPPLCVVGMGLVLGRPELTGSAEVIFLLNVVGIVLASCAVFWMFGFARMARVQEKMIEEERSGG